MKSPQKFSVPDITCDHCIAAITGEVTQVAAVTSVDVDIDTKTVTVMGGEPSAIIAAIDEAGFDVAASLRQSAVAKIQLDTGAMRVTTWTFPPGSETGDHVHEFDYVVVPIEGGDLTIVSADGSTTVAAIATGIAYNREKGVAHNVINDTAAVISFVEVELLDR